MKNSYLKLIAVTVLCCVYWGGVRAQCPSDLILKKQSEVDQFPQKYPNCKQLRYSLSVSGNIMSLDSLIQLEKGVGIYIESNVGIEHLNGLSNITEIRDLTIRSNPKLTDISTINKIKTIYSLIIKNNSTLKSIDGFDSLTIIENLDISTNEKLEQINAFRNLEMIEKYFQISNCKNLKSIQPFNKLKEIRSNCAINSTGITQLDFLPELRYVGYFSISSNHQLTIIDQLKSLRNATDIVINDNNNLIEISNFYPDSVKSIYIFNDSNLLTINCFGSIRSLQQLYIYQNDKLKNIHSARFPLKILSFLYIVDNSELIDLDHFDLCKEIGTININNNAALLSANFLNKLEKIHFEINIWDNLKLKALEINGLKKMADLIISIKNNSSLANIKMIESNQFVLNSIILENNPSLTNFQTVFYNSITTATIVNNISLRNLDFLKGVNDIEKNCNISQNNALIDLAALKELMVVGDLIIKNNDNLKELILLDGLIIARSILISSNFSLTSILGPTNVNKSVKKSFRIDNNPLLKEISGTFLFYELDTLEIFSNASLEKIDFSNLIKSFKLVLNISSNPQLMTINFPRVKNIKELTIFDNGRLQKVGGFDSLIEVNDINIEDNSSIVDLSSFASINKCENITVSKNNILLDLKQFKALHAIKGDVIISNNESLEGLFADIKNIEGRTIITNNPLLQDISGLRNIPVLLNYTIMNNAALSACEIASICNSFDKETNRYFYNNGYSCRYNAEVKEKCKRREVIIYPNPAHNTINFTAFPLDNIAKITIYDTYGRQVQMIKTTQPEVDISALTAGTYILQVESENINFKKKFVKY